MKKGKLMKMFWLSKKLFIIICFIIGLSYTYGQQTITQWLNTAQQRIDTLRKGDFSIQVFDSNGNTVNDSISINLKRHEFVFGCANDFSSSNYSSDPKLPSNNDWIKANMLKYFNLNVTGNAYKWSGIQPYSATSYNYGPVDSVLKWSESSGFNNLKGHTLIWGAYNDSDYHSIPKWAMQLPSNQAIYNACETRVRSMVSHYKGRFKEIDVLNEPIHATWLKTKLGTDSIYWNLFKWAKEEDPSAKLYINDYNVEYNWGDAIAYKALIKKMLSKGAPIDGIGVQAHFWSGDINLSELKQNMDTLATLGLPMKFTEFDLASMTQSKQATNTAAAFRFAFSHPAFNGIISWGFWDIGVWRENSGFFDVNKNPKLAADTIYNLLHKIWTTKISSQLINSNINFKGYFGEYEVKVKFGNTWKLFTINCNKLYNDSVFVLNEQNSSIIGPHFVSAKLISKNQVLVKFDKKLNDPLASIRAFKIFQVNPLKIDSISLLSKDSSVVYIKLASSVNNNLITVFYSNGNLKSADGGTLKAFGPEKIENNYVTLVSANTSKDGKSVEAKFNKSMVDPSAQLASFKIFVNGVSVGIDSVRLKTVNDSIMVFSLPDAITGGDTVSLTYVAGLIASTDNRELASFSNFEVLNIVPNFLLISANTSIDGKTIEVKFNMPVSDPTGELANFTILVNSITAVIDSVGSSSVNDSVVVFYLFKAVKVGENVKLSYTEGNFASADGFKLITFSNYTVLNRVPILDLISAGTTTDGKTILAIFNKPMADPSLLLSSFKIYVNGTSVAMDSVRLKQSNDSVMVFTLLKVVKPGDVIKFFHYTGSVASADGEKLATIRLFAVTNNTVVTGTNITFTSEFSLYPNPTKDFVIIKGVAGLQTVRIYNTMGQLILEKVVYGEDETIDVSDLPVGTYIVFANTSKGKTMKTKLFKTK